MELISKCRVLEKQIAHYRKTFDSIQKNSLRNSSEGQEQPPETKVARNLTSTNKLQPEDAADTMAESSQKDATPLNKLLGEAVKKQVKITEPVGFDFFESSSAKTDLPEDAKDLSDHQLHRYLSDQKCYNYNRSLVEMQVKTKFDPPKTKLDQNQTFQYEKSLCKTQRTKAPKKLASKRDQRTNLSPEEQIPMHQKPQNKSPSPARAKVKSLDRRFIKDIKASHLLHDTKSAQDLRRENEILKKLLPRTKPENLSKKV